MILGAGPYQVPLIRKARSMGLRVIAVSIAGDYPGFDEADDAVFLDVRDAQGVLGEARARRIDAVVTNQTDLSVTTAAYVAEKMGLPGIGRACATRFTNKLMMREVAERCGGAAIAFRRAASPEAAAAAAETMRFPLVVKPVSSQGSRGVTKVARGQELAAAVLEAQAHAASGEVLVEEYFEGREVALDGLSVRGEFQNLPLGDIELFDDGARLVARSGSYPSDLDAALQRKVCALNERIVRAMGIPFGLTHSEFRVCEATGEVLLLETAARGGGAFISSDLVPLACGLDVERILLEQVLGRPVPEARQSARRAAAYVCAGGFPDGILRDVRGLDVARSIPGFVRAVLQKRIGDAVGPLVDKTSRPAIFLLDGETRDDLARTRKDLSEAVCFVVETAGGPVQVRL